MFAGITYPPSHDDRVRKQTFDCCRLFQQIKDLSANFNLSFIQDYSGHLVTPFASCFAFQKVRVVHRGRLLGWPPHHSSVPGPAGPFSSLVPSKFRTFRGFQPPVHKRKVTTPLFIGPRSDHSLPMSVTHSLTHSLTDDLVEDLMN